MITSQWWHFSMFLEENRKYLQLVIWDARTHTMMNIFCEIKRKIKVVKYYSHYTQRSSSIHQNPILYEVLE